MHPGAVNEIHVSLEVIYMLLIKPIVVRITRLIHERKFLDIQKN